MVMICNNSEIVQVIDIVFISRQAERMKTRKEIYHTHTHIHTHTQILNIPKTIMWLDSLATTPKMCKEETESRERDNHIRIPKNPSCGAKIH